MIFDKASVSDAYRISRPPFGVHTPLQPNLNVDPLEIRFHFYLAG